MSPAEPMSHAEWAHVECHEAMAMTEPCADD
jgi:hypothetical protein